MSKTKRVITCHTRPYDARRKKEFHTVSNQSSPETDTKAEV